MKALSLKLPEDLEAELTRVARQRGTSKSALVRAAIEELLERSPRPSKGSVADLARDLIGFLEGPGDLSHNPERMQGFGR